MERRINSQRTVSALSAKKAREEKLGRPNAVKPSQVRGALEMIEAGKGVSYVARLFGCDRATLYREMQRSA